MKTRNVVIGVGAALAAGVVTAAVVRRYNKTIPSGIKPVQPFDIKKYLGQWYEIAHLDFGHEKDGLSHVTVEYTMNQDGTVHVLNRGYNQHKKSWQSASCKAKFVGDPQVAMLKVSFFGPFYSGYNVVEIDNDYQYALVVGRSRDYLWILSRGKTLPKKTEQELLEKAAKLGFDLEKLVWTFQG